MCDKMRLGMSECYFNGSRDYFLRFTTRSTLGAEERME